MQPCAGGVTTSPLLATAPQQRERPTPGSERYPPNLLPLERFEPISLVQMDAVALMNRTDVKFVLGLPQLCMVLTALVGDYCVLQVEGLRLHHYRTLYFDTDGLDLYISHHMGRCERYKVRSRSYLDSGLSFLEVKRRTKKGTTIKNRIGTETLLTQLTLEARRFVDGLARPAAGPLQPRLWSEFSRITLVSKCRHERVTLDVDMRYWAGDSSVLLTGVVVAEVKQERLDRGSPLMAQMRALGLRPTPFTKYCVGMAMLYPELKHNRFKPVLRLLGHIMRGDYHV